MSCSVIVTTKNRGQSIVMLVTFFYVQRTVFSKYQIRDKNVIIKCME